MFTRAILFFFALGTLTLCRVETGHTQSPENDLPSLLRQGKAHYEAGRYAESQTAFEEVVAQQSKSAMAHYWLGMALYQQNQDKEALKRFKKSIRYDKKAPEGYIGMGLVYMRTKNRLMDAREAFRKAERWNKKNADIQYYLGMVNVQQSKRDPLGLYYIGKARKAFIKAVQLDPKHPDAYFQMAQTYEIPPRDCRKATPLYFQQLMVAPDHPEALKHFGSCAIAGEQYQEGISMLDQLAEAYGEHADPMIKTFRLQLTAAWLEDKREFEQSLDAYEEYISALEPAERNLYTDLSYIAKEDVMKEYEWADDQTKAEIWRMFWATRDPDPSTIVNERLVEHYRRIMYVRIHFSSGKKPWDRRGDIYIRYGEPDDRQKIGIGFSPTGNAGVDAIRGRFPYLGDQEITESWVYVPYNLELIFWDQYGNGTFDYPPRTIHPWTNTFHPEILTKALIKRTPDGYQYDFGAEGPIDVAIDVVTFKEPDNKTRIEVAYGVPLAQLGQADDGRGMLTWLDSRMVLQDENFHHVTALNEEVGPIERALSDQTIEKNEARIAQLSVDVFPGQYRSALAVRDKTSQRIGVYKLPLQVWDYGADSLMISDIKLASSITPSTDSGPFTRGNLEIVPNPSRTYSDNQPVHLYYEIYNLNQNETGQTAYQTQLRVTTKEKRHGFWGKIASGISKAGKIIGQSNDEQAVIITFEDAGTTRDTYKFPTIDTTDLPAGSYTVTLTITDQHTDYSYSRTADFVVAERED